LALRFLDPTTSLRRAAAAFSSAEAMKKSATIAAMAM